VHRKWLVVTGRKCPTILPSIRQVSVTGITQVIGVGMSTHTVSDLCLADPGSQDIRNLFLV
jgi:hypothetical protein